MTDSDYMQLAIAEARKGLNLTSPNPAVGAIIVKDGEILGRGWHRKAGLPHAEREALADALNTHGEGASKGASIYVTLEPCSTTGRTPACVDGVIEAGIAHVIYGATDPNPDHAGAADTLLEKHGIKVTSGVEEEACMELIQAFSKRITTGLPWVVAKTAMSLDGRITRPKGEGQWLTGKEAREEVHRIRASVDAIITGGRTVRNDNPSLTIRGAAYQPEKLQPWRVVLTQSGRQNLPEGSNIFTDEHAERSIIHEDKTLTDTLKELADLGCNSVMLECGGGLMRQFLEQDLVDEVAIFIAPMLTGGNDHGFGLGEHLTATHHLDQLSTKMLGNDVMLCGVIRR